MVDSKKRPGKDLDRIDRNILNELQKDGRISNVELSKRVGLLLIHTATVPGQPGAVVRFSIGREKPGTWRAFFEPGIY